MRLKLLILTQNDIAVNSTEKSLHEHLKLLLLLKLFLDVLVAVALLENHLIFLWLEKFQEVHDDLLLYVTFDTSRAEIRDNVFEVLLVD